MATAAAIKAAFASIPTVVLKETVRIVVRGETFEAEEIMKGLFEGSRTFAYTNAAGNGCIVRTKA